MGIYAQAEVFFGIKLPIDKVSDEELNNLDNSFEYVEISETECFIGISITKMSSSIVPNSAFKQMVMNSNILSQATTCLKNISDQTPDFHLNLNIG